MSYLCPFPNSNESVILYQINHKKKVAQLHVGVTSAGGAGVNLLKPTLLKCKKCNLIFSEYTDVDFEDAYSHVVDETYIKQIEFKTKTFNNSKNFDVEVAKFIFASSPLYTQQIAIPNEEFIRLEKKFNKTRLQNFNEPEIIVLEKLRPITKNIVIKKNNYCKLYDGNIYILYFKKNSEIKCDS